MAEWIDDGKCYSEMTDEPGFLPISHPHPNPSPSNRSSFEEKIVFVKLFRNELYFFVRLFFFTTDFNSPTQDQTHRAQHSTRFHSSNRKHCKIHLLFVNDLVENGFLFSVIYDFSLAFFSPSPYHFTFIFLETAGKTWRWKLLIIIDAKTFPNSTRPKTDSHRLTLVAVVAIVCDVVVVQAVVPVAGV